jgi:hypothetical protein
MHLMEFETDEQAIRRVMAKFIPIRYAILSHTWLRSSDEVTYSAWNKGVFNTSDPGYQKLVNFCKAAWMDHGLTLGWMDTVCINKDSSAELDESIRSMYNWYSRAHVCITYLAETETISDMHNDRWFTRGWTFQELLAPPWIKFYNRDWKPLADHFLWNDIRDPKITAQITRATSITKYELGNIFTASISRRMQMAANREVTREEDTAYSLMGIFNVSISIAYGEGAQRAFFRLLQEILVFSANKVLDIFNWAGEPPRTQLHASRMLPSSPASYLHRASNVHLKLGRPIEPLTLTHLGLRVPVILMPALSKLGTPLSTMLLGDPYWKIESVGDYTANVMVSAFTGSQLYDALVKRLPGPDGPGNGVKKNYDQITLAVLNFEGDAINVHVPRTCLAIGLYCKELPGEVSAFGEIATIPTQTPIIFELKRTSKTAPVSTEIIPGDGAQKMYDDDYYHIKRQDLKRHGMQMVSLNL